MTLLEILARYMATWPLDTSRINQDSDGCIFASRPREGCSLLWHHPEAATDAEANDVARFEWLAARYGWLKSNMGEKK